MALKVLFIGGTGVISSACSELALQRGIDLTLFTRGNSPRPAPPGAKLVRGDINQPQEIASLLDHNHFDAVVNWVVYQPEEAQRDIGIFSGVVGQYIFISSASAYQKPVPRLPITEETPLGNPIWKYSQAKQSCEELLFQAYETDRFPVTVVRPSHTYDKTLLPFHGGYTTLDRIINGKPVIIHGDGTSLWVLTHHRDFARGFLGLLGKEQALGEAYQITSDEILTWNRIYQSIAEAAGADLRPVHIPSDIIARADPVWGDSLLGDKAHSVIFDNSKIKSLVPDFKAEIPYQEGCRETVRWYLDHPEQRSINQDLDLIMDQLISHWQ
jgi:nucleoside-diphosphate-sugar epimerase